MRCVTRLSTAIWHPPAPGATLPYAAIPILLTNAEQRFFVALQAAVPEGLIICPQVRLANLVRPTARKAQQNTYDFYGIQAKCVDFVLCNRATTAPRLVIELDDASHARQNRTERDAFVDAVLAAVRLPVLHVRWQRRYDTAQLAADIRHALGMHQPVAAPPSDAWARPIAVEPRMATTAATAAVVQHRPRYVCGTCQGDVPRDSHFCHQCGTILARR